MTIIEDAVGIEFGIDQLIIIGVIYAAIKRNRSFFVDWLPFLVLWMTYDLMRGIADDNRYIHVKEIYDLELSLFGWMFGGQIPNFWIQQYTNHFFDVVFAIFYTLHMPAPLILAFSIYYRNNDKPMFKEFSYTFLVTSYLALITFALYPVAPPWYVWAGGKGLRFEQPPPETHVEESAAGLVNVDRLLGKNLFSSFYETFNANPYAALPSLHSAYSIITAYYAIKKYGKKSRFMVLYPVGVWFGAVYLNHHYIVDLVAGGLYVVVAILIVTTIRKRLGIPSTIAEVEDQGSEETKKMRNESKSSQKGEFDTDTLDDQS